MKITVKGIVVSVPVDGRQTRIAVAQDGDEYRILPRAAGIDLEDEINVSVEVRGELLEEDEVKYLTVRSYKVLEDDAWDEDNR
ncbi:MAG: hypothetical protein K6G15_04680 [Desulfovibrio sp.]|nr:hypothetical protein [Desulfovibrio sp.]